MESIYDDLQTALKAQDPDKFGELTQKALDAGADPVELLNKIVTMAKKMTEEAGGQAERKARVVLLKGKHYYYLTL